MVAGGDLGWAPAVRRGREKGEALPNFRGQTFEVVLTTEGWWQRGNFDKGGELRRAELDMRCHWSVEKVLGFFGGRNRAGTKNLQKWGKGSDAFVAGGERREGEGGIRLGQGNVARQRHGADGRERVDGADTRHAGAGEGGPVWGRREKG
jgi:hypothetical protein